MIVAVPYYKIKPLRGAGSCVALVRRYR